MTGAYLRVSACFFIKRSRTMIVRLLFLTKGFAPGFDIVQCIFSLVFHLIRCLGFGDFGRTAQQNGTGWCMSLSRNQGTGSYQTAFLQNSAVQNDGTHTDQAIVSNGTAVDNGTMTDCAVIADHSFFMDNAVVLNIAALTDSDGSAVTPQNSAVPDADILF